MGGQTGTGSGFYRPGDSVVRGREFMAGMEDENPEKRDKRITAFKETHENFFSCYDDWKKEEQDLDAETSYSAAAKMLEEHKIPIVNEDTLNSFLETIYEETERKGIFLSAMINTLYENKGISIYPGEQKISYMGMNNDGKDIFVRGWLHDFVGMNMKSGSMDIKHGVSGKNIGEGMESGTISIDDAYRPKLDTDTKLSKNIKGGKIIYNDKCVWSKRNIRKAAQNWARHLCGH